RKTGVPCFRTGASATGSRPMMRGPFFTDWLKPLIMSLAAVAATTAVLVALNIPPEHQQLVFAYFVPTAFIAIRYNSRFAMAATVASILAADYFLAVPRFSFGVADPREIVGMAFFAVLALLASQVVAGIAADVERQRQRRPVDAPAS